jgi:hypothetical protein
MIASIRLEGNSMSSSCAPGELNSRRGRESRVSIVRVSIDADVPRPSVSSRPKSPYTLAYSEQIALCLRRGFWRLKADPSLTASMLFGNIIMGLIVSSVFFNLPSVSTTEERMDTGTDWLIGIGFCLQR